MSRKHSAMSRNDEIGHLKNLCATTSQLIQILGSRVVILAPKPPKMTDGDSTWLFLNIRNTRYHQGGVLSGMSRRLNNPYVRRYCITIATIKPLVEVVDRRVVDDPSFRKQTHVARMVRMVVSYEDRINVRY